MLAISNRWVRCYVPEKEASIIDGSLFKKWQNIYVPSGKIEKEVAPHVYSIGSVAIEAKTRVTLAMKEIYVRPGWEDMIRIGVVPVEKENLIYGVQEKIVTDYPPMTELQEYPDDLNIKPFLGTENFLELVRFRTPSKYSAHGVDELNESGLLARNDEARLLLYPDEKNLPNMCITTDEDTIEAVTEDHGIVPVMLGPFFRIITEEDVSQDPDDQG